MKLKRLELVSKPLTLLLLNVKIFICYLAGNKRLGIKKVFRLHEKPIFLSDWLDLFPTPNQQMSNCEDRISPQKE